MKILLVADVPGWAWDHKADAIIRNLSHLHDIDKIYCRSADYEKINPRSYDAIHFFGWQGSPWVDLCTTAVSSHNFRRDIPYAQREISKFRGVSAVCRLIYNELKSLNLKCPVYLCENGVETDWFTPPYKKKSTDDFVVGWSGQVSHESTDQHGYHNILMPLKKELEHNGVKLKIITNNWQNAMPHREMINFYHGLDVMLHTGHLTGTPNPIFEAASCEVPVLSTTIGSANDMIVNGKNGFLFELFDNFPKDAAKVVTNIYNGIMYLANNRDVCESLGKEARKTVVRDWTWKERAKQWLPLFENHRIK